MSKIKISISVDDTHLSQIEQVSRQLQSSGMSVEQTLSSIGVISGSISNDRLDGLKKIEGVKNIEPQENYQLAPPDSDVQ